MYQYTAPFTILLALRQRFQVAGSIRVKGSRMGTRFPTLLFRTVSMCTVSSESVRNKWSLALLPDFLVSCFCLLACLAGNCAGIINQPYAVNYASLDHLPDGIRGDVHEAPVQCREVHALLQSHCCIHTLCLI